MVRSSWDTFQTGRSEKARIINDLRRELGYDGMIHHFKNYILRHEPAHITSMKKRLGGALSQIARYQSLGISTEENSVLAEIEKVLVAYEQALETAMTMVAEGNDSSAIDSKVLIDDAPALAGLDELDRIATRAVSKQHLPSRS